MIVLIPLDEDKKAVCPAFGRAPYFLRYDTESGKSEALENPAADAEGGAGVKCAQFVADCGTDILITPRCGENAAQVLNAAEIKIYKSLPLSAEDNIKAFSEGRLEPLTHFHAGYHGIR